MTKRSLCSFTNASGNHNRNQQSFGVHTYIPCLEPKTLIGNTINELNYKLINKAFINAGNSARAVKSRAALIMKTGRGNPKGRPRS